MKVAAAQFAPQFKEPAKNIQTMLNLIAEAVARQAKLIVLPEMATTGYSFMSASEARPFAESLHDSPTRTLLQKISGQRGIAIAWGMLTHDSKGDMHNSQVLVLPDGRWTSYDKVNLWGNDFLTVQPGDASPPIIEFGGKKIGLLVCRDVRDKGPAMGDLYEKGDADIVAFSANWGNGGFPAVKWVEFAKENGVFLVVGNRYGKEEHNNFGSGGICVIEPCGKVHCEGLQWSKPCVVYAEVS